MMKAVITGATRGIGRAVTIEFARQGMDVALCARSEKDLAALKKILQKEFPNREVLTMTCDVSDKKQVKKFADFIIKSWKSIDVLVNNAGTYITGGAHQAKDNALENIMSVNLYGSYYLTQYLVKGMMKQRLGHVFNLCSTASLQAYANGGLYSISKFAMLGFSKNLREELYPYNVKVTSVMPGAVDTDTWGGTKFPPKRLMPAEDIAKLIYSAYNTAEQTVVEEILIRPIKKDIRQDEL